MSGPPCACSSSSPSSFFSPASSSLLLYAASPYPLQKPPLWQVNDPSTAVLQNGESYRSFEGTESDIDSDHVAGMAHLIAHSMLDDDEMEEEMAEAANRRSFEFAKIPTAVSPELSKWCYSHSHSHRRSSGYGLSYNAGEPYSANCPWQNISSRVLCEPTLLVDPGPMKDEPFSNSPSLFHHQISTLKKNIKGRYSQYRLPPAENQPKIDSNNQFRSGRCYEGSGMHAVFLKTSNSRGSVGTGVFLPRPCNSSKRKKTSLSTVLLPSKVVQALNLRLEDSQPHLMSPQHRESESSLDSHGKPLSCSPLQQITADVSLPTEWTY